MGVFLPQHEHFGWFHRREIVLHTTTTQEEDTKPHTHTHTQDEKLKTQDEKLKTQDQKLKRFGSWSLISIFNKFVTEIIIIIMKQAQKKDNLDYGHNS